MKKNNRPLIWYVDDLPENLARFYQDHKDQFEIKTFSNPTELYRELSSKRPDAILCDIFFYDSPQEADEIEIKINEKANSIRDFAHNELHADKEEYLAGIKLIEEIDKKYKHNAPFPVYAYTSKGPYILDKNAWDRIVNSNAKILPKNKLGKNSIQLIIDEDINKYKVLNSWSIKIAENIWKYVITTGLLSAVIGAVFSWLLYRLF
jgi:hypothetical protein